MRSFTLALATVVLLACQPPPPKADAAEAAPSEPVASKPAPNPNCVVEPIAAELLGYCDFDLGVPPVALAEVPWTAASYHPLATRVISLDRKGLRDPEGQGGEQAIAAWLSDPPRRLPEPGEMVFAIAGDVSIEQVAELFGGLAAAGRKRIRVLVQVADSRPVPQPRKPEMLDELREGLPTDPNERVVFVANGIRALAQQHCPQLGGVFPQLVQVPPGDRCGRLAALSAKVLVECRCEQLPELMTMLYALTMGFEPPGGRAAAVELELDPAQAVAAEPGSTWAQMVARTLGDPSPRALFIHPDGAP